MSTVLPSHIRSLIRPNILTLEPYRCARDDYEEGILLDANENAYGPPLVEEKSNELPHSTLSTFHLERYPDPHQIKLKTIISSIRGTTPANIAVGNGSDELIDLLMRIFCKPSTTEHILTCPPTYGMYKVTAKVNDVGVVEVPLLKENFQLDVEKILDTVTPDTKLMFLCSPGNPTACLLKKEDIITILKSDKYKGMVIVDEAYVDFALSSSNGSASCCDLVMNGEKDELFSRVVVMQTLSKAWGLAGIRCGMVFCHPSVAQVINNVKAPYNLNKVTAAIARQALSNGQAKLAETLSILLNERKRVSTSLSSLNFVLDVYPSDSNFILFRLIKEVDAKVVYQNIAESGVVIRFRGTQTNCDNCLRATVGTTEENTAMIEHLVKVVENMKKN
jgi:histidinol-phosphate aminotransferase